MSDDASATGLEFETDEEERLSKEKYEENLAVALQREDDYIERLENELGQPYVWVYQGKAQREFLRSPSFECLIEGTRGGGKCVNDATMILTDSGWVRADDVTMLDCLVAEDGSYTKIKGIFPQPLKTMYEVSFHDGAKVVVGHDHRWKVGSSKNFHRDGWRVKTTQELFDTTCPSEWFIPFMSGPHGGEKWNGPDPYVIGLVAGDGTLTGTHVTIYNDDREILDYLSDRGWVSYEKPGIVPRRIAAAKWIKDPIRKTMRLCGSGDKKSIPSEILRADAETRLACLQGLMDSDGSCDKEGRCRFDTVSPRLRDQVMELAYSLGGRGTYCTKKFSKEGHTDREFYYCVTVSHMNKFNPFRLSRKRDRVKKTTKKLTRTIAEIVPVESVPSRCFAVEHESHCFVIQDYIVTHNTDVLIMDFQTEVGKGFGEAWRGILFRQTYPQLADVTAKIMRWYPKIYGDAFTFNAAKMRAEFSSGEMLLLRHMKRLDDYWNYHGHEYPWQGWEELTNWANMDFYFRMMSCCRTSVEGVPRRIRATTNPYGPGHGPVKEYFDLPRCRKVIRKIKRKDPLTGGVIYTTRQVIPSSVKDNKLLLRATPDYMAQLKAAASNEAEEAAWLEGDWDIQAGGMFDTVWRKCKQFALVREFTIPKSWEITRSFDWGSSAPFSVGWYAESDGSPIVRENGEITQTVKGDLFRIYEWYGARGKNHKGLEMLSSEITAGIISRELAWGIHGRVKKGVADSAIFEKSRGESIAQEMKKPVTIAGTVYPGIIQYACEKGPGSRVNGWQVCRERLAGTIPEVAGTRNDKKKGLFIVEEHNPEFIRTFPTLPRDEKDMNDVDTKSEDHIGDEVRYRVMWHKPVAKQRSF